MNDTTSPHSYSLQTLSDNIQDVVSENQNDFLSPGHFPVLHLHQHFCNQNQTFPLVYGAESKMRGAEQKPKFLSVREETLN